MKNTSFENAPCAWQAEPAHLRHGQWWIGTRWLGLGSQGASGYLQSLDLQWLQEPRPVTRKMHGDKLMCLQDTSLYHDGRGFWQILGWQEEVPWLYCYPIEIEGLDYATLREVSPDYFADRNGAYFYGNNLRLTPMSSEVDLATFGPLLGASEQEQQAIDASDYRYARDQHHIYRDGSRYCKTSAGLQLTHNDHYVRIGEKLLYNDFRVLREDTGKPLTLPPERPFRLLSHYWGTDGVALYLLLCKGNSRTGSWETMLVIDDADLAHFRLLGDHYATDGQRVWHTGSGKVLARADAARFRRVSSAFSSLTEDDFPELAQDDTRVYCAGTAVKGLDAATLHWVGGRFFTGSGQWWWACERKLTPLPDLDGPSFHLPHFADEPHEDVRNALRGQATDRHGIWDNGRRKIVFTPEDVARWRPWFEAHPNLQDYWWHRAAQAAAHPGASDAPAPAAGHCEAAQVPPPMQTATQTPTQAPAAPQPASAAAAASTSTADPQDLGYDFSWLNGQPHYRDQPLHNVDAASFCVVNAYHFADRNGLYTTLGEPLLRAPWRWLDARHATDGQAVVFVAPGFGASKSFAGAAIDQARGDGWGWLCDGQSVWYGGVKKRELDAAQFVSLGLGYAHDGQHLFRRGKRLKLALDLPSTQALSPDFVRDGQGALAFQSKAVGRAALRSIDVARLSFYPGHGYAQDGQRVYYVGPFGLKPIGGADLPSFAAADLQFAHDAQRPYDRYELMKSDYSEDTITTYFAVSAASEPGQTPRLWPSQD